MPMTRPGASTSLDATAQPGVAPSPRTGDAGSTAPPTYAIPPDSRLVGVGHAAIAVPKAWPFNKTGCGTPVQDTVIINVSAVPLCLIPRPPGVTAVDIQHRPTRPRYPDFANADAVELDGSPAWRTTPLLQGGVWTQAMWIPGESALLTATAPAAAITQRLLGTVRLLERRVAVPQSNMAGHAKPILKRFTKSAEDLGFTVAIRSVKARPSFSTGWIMGTSPPTGTVARIGSTIRVTLAR
jgi:hypothetical protein